MAENTGNLSILALFNYIRFLKKLDVRSSLQISVLAACPVQTDRLESQKSVWLQAYKSLMEFNKNCKMFIIQQIMQEAYPKPFLRIASPI